MKVSKKDRLQHQHVDVIAVHQLHCAGGGGAILGPRSSRVTERRLRCRNHLGRHRLVPLHRCRTGPGQAWPGRGVVLTLDHVALDARRDLADEVQRHLTQLALRGLDPVARQQLRAEAEQHGAGHRPLWHIQRGEQISHQILHQRLEVDLLHLGRLPPLEQLLPKVVTPAKRRPITCRLRGLTGHRNRVFPPGRLGMVIERHARLDALHQHGRDHLDGVRVIVRKHVASEPATGRGQLEQRHQDVVHNEPAMLWVMLEGGHHHVHRFGLNQVHVLHQQRGDAQVGHLQHGGVREVDHKQKVSQLRQRFREHAVDGLHRLGHRSLLCRGARAFALRCARGALAPSAGLHWSLVGVVVVPTPATIPVLPRTPVDLAVRRVDKHEDVVRHVILYEIHDLVDTLLPIHLLGHVFSAQDK
mmetsp:Transcript_26086/g.65321  ORF Transcript_26086/g.65321 Transcript_26086/m.65321 type:complete len:415 (+) Transcript_26086:1141-2385(+)